MFMYERGGQYAIFYYINDAYFLIALHDYYYDIYNITK